jgi:uncharacterized protein YdaL
MVYNKYPTPTKFLAIKRQKNIPRTPFLGRHWLFWMSVKMVQVNFVDFLDQIIELSACFKRYITRLCKKNKFSHKKFK